MTTSLIIPIHSVIDVITNSSSEIFVAADQSTVKAIKKLVDNIIGAAGMFTDGSAADGPSADDLFTFELMTLCYDGGYKEVYLNEKELIAKKKEIEEIRENEGEKYTEEQVADADEWSFQDGEDSESPQNQVRVTVKDKTNKDAVAAAKVLSELTKLFNIESQYC